MVKAKRVILAKLKIKKGDNVEVLLGRDKGRRGKVKAVFSKERKALVDKINIAKKHLKAQSEKHPGGILEIAKPIFISKLAVVCPDCDKKTRVAFQLGNNGKKTRVCRHCLKSLDGGRDDA